jgi:hypothetical protein
VIQDDSATTHAPPTIFEAIGSSDIRAAFRWAILPWAMDSDMACNQIVVSKRSVVGCYNVVTNFGTLEHILNKSFANIHDLLKVGGIQLHAIPS